MGSDDESSKSGKLCKSSSSRCKVKKKVKSKVMRRLSVKSKSRRVKSLSMKSSSSTGQFSAMKENVNIKSDEKMVDVSSGSLSSSSNLNSSNSSRILGGRSQSSCFKVKRQVKVQRGVSMVKVKVKKIRSLKSSSNNVLTEKSITSNANSSNSKSSTTLSALTTGKDKESPSASPAASPKQQYHDSLLYTCPEFYDCPYGFKHDDFEPFLVGSKSIVNIRKADDLDKVVIIDANGEVEVASPVPPADKSA